MPQTKPIIFIRDAPGQRRQVMDVALEVERRGLMGVMSPSSGDNIALSLAVLDRTERIMVGTGIANIYTRHPAEMASAASLIEELHPGRFVLGIAPADARAAGCRYRQAACRYARVRGRSTCGVGR